MERQRSEVDEVMRRAELIDDNLTDFLKRMEEVRFEFSRNFRLSAASKERLLSLDGTSNLPPLERLEFSRETYVLLKQGEFAKKNMEKMTEGYHAQRESFFKDFVNRSLLGVVDIRRMG